MYLKNQIFNHLTLDGKKSIGEQIFLKTLKELYKITNKDVKKVIGLALLSSTPIFKINKEIKKTPIIIWNQKARISLAIKFILIALKQRKAKYLYIKLCTEIISNGDTESLVFELKNNFQKQALLKKHLFFYYKWK